MKMEKRKGSKSRGNSEAKSSAEEDGAVVVVSPIKENKIASDATTTNVIKPEDLTPSRKAKTKKSGRVEASSKSNYGLKEAVKDI